MAGSDYYLLDETNITFVPSTCSDAILLWNRIRARGINNWDDVPRILQHCARALNEKEHDAFAQFICQPTNYTMAEPKEDYFSHLQVAHPDGPIPKSQEVPEDDEKSPGPTESSDPVHQGHSTDSGSGCDNDSSRT